MAWGVGKGRVSRDHQPADSRRNPLGFPRCHRKLLPFLVSGVLDLGSLRQSKPEALAILFLSVILASLQLTAVLLPLVSSFQLILPQVCT